MKITINKKSGVTKLQQLINELIRVINTNYKKGDVLPSVNQLSKQLGLSRDTVFKAYSELKKQKVVDSTPTKGYYVYRKMNKVLMVLDFYSPFKDLMYREFESSLGEEWKVDLVFHHYNKQLFDLVIIENCTRYNYFIIMNIDTVSFTIAPVLKKINPQKLLLLDIPIKNWKNFNAEKYNYLWQDFEESAYKALHNLRTNINKYDNFKFVYTKHLKHPAGTLNAYIQFCADIRKKPIVMYNTENIDVQSGDSYFVFRETNLYDLLVVCKLKGFELGRDVGILAFNDIPLYEFVSCGITVISTDFKLLGKQAAQFINKGIRLKKTMPIENITRKSL